jgi:hypothetical protein
MWQQPKNDDGLLARRCPCSITHAGQRPAHDRSLNQDTYRRSLKSIAGDYERQ